MTSDDMGRAAEIGIWREAYRQLALSKMREKGLTQGALAQKLGKHSSDLSPYIGRNAAPSRGELNGAVNLAINAELGISDADLARLPGGGDPASTFYVPLIQEDPAAATDRAIAEALYEQLGPEISPEAILALARAGLIRADNSGIPGKDLRDQAQKALEDGRNEDAEKLLDAHDALIAEAHRETNRVDFPMKVMRAGLLARTHKYYEAIDAFGKALARADGVEPEDVAAAELARRKLIHFKASRKESLAEAREILSRSYVPAFSWDVVSFNILIAKTGTLAEGKALLDEMTARGIAPNVISHSSLIAKAGSVAEGKTLFDVMTARGIAPNDISYNTLIAKAGSVAEGKALLNEMKARGIAPNVISYNTLIAKAGNVAEGKALLDEMKARGIAPDVYSYSSLIAKAGSVSEGKALLDEMTARGIAPNVISYTSLIVLAPSDTHAASLYREMKNAGLEPDLPVFTTLINMSAHFGTAMGYFRDLIKGGIRPDRFVMQVMVRKAPDFKTARDLVNAMRYRLKIRPDLASWKHVVTLADTQREAREIVDLMWEDKVRVDYRFLQHLQRRQMWDEIDRFEELGLIG